MEKYYSYFWLIIFVLLIYSCKEQTTKNIDPLPYWNDGKAKQRIKKMN